MSKDVELFALHAGPPTIDDVNSRIDKCIKDNSVPECLLWIVLFIMAVVGIFSLVWGVVHDYRYLVAASMGATGLSSWPVVKLIQLYRRKIALSVIPAITVLLTPADAAREVHALTGAAFRLA